MDAMFPVLKKADCRMKRKKRQILASERVRARYLPDLKATSRVRAAFKAGVMGEESSFGLPFFCV